MKTVDLTSLRDIDGEYDKLVNQVSDKYKCEWDDSVHDSYAKLVSRLMDNSALVHTIRCKVEMIEKELEALKIEEISKKSASLCKEADTI